MSASPKSTEKSNIELANIERELTKLWASFDSANTQRACLFNLIIFTRDPKREDYFQTILTTVADRFPCRIIMIKSDENAAESYLRSSVAAEVSRASGRAVACEKLIIEASQDLLQRVPFIILPHLQADLPVYLLWGQDPTRESTVLPQLEHLADRVIFDSEFCDDLRAFSEKVRQDCSRLRCTVADMNWARGHGWRNLLSQTFHDEKRVDQLMNCSVMRIQYNGKQNAACQHNAIQALYLQAWIAAQMTWQFASKEQMEGNTRIVYNTGARQCSVLLTPQMSSGTPAGTLLNVDIETHDAAHFQFSRVGDTRTVQVQFSTPDHCDLPYHHLLSSMKREHALLQEVFYEPPSAHYTTMLEMLAHLTP